MTWYIFQGPLKDSLERYTLYGLEENSSYDCNYKDEIEDVIKLVSWYGSPACVRIIIIINIIIFVTSKT